MDSRPRNRGQDVRGKLPRDRAGCPQPAVPAAGPPQGLQGACIRLTVATKLKYNFRVP